MAPYIPIDYTGHQESEFLKLRSVDSMGKSRKHSKELSTKRTHDYRLAVETVADSDSLGSSGRVDQEFVASGPGRGYFSGEGLDGPAVPFEIFSLYHMSLLDKKQLETRLMGELERIRKIQSRMSFFNTDGMIRPPIADAHSYPNERMRYLDADGTQAQDASFPAVKRKFPPGKNGAPSKSGSVLPRRNEPVRNGAPQSANFDMLWKQCGTLLSRLMGHKLAWIFNKPVDVVEHKIPDYFNIIKHPMDLGTVKVKLRSKQYVSPQEFAADVRLTFNNAMTYNPVGHEVHAMADTLTKIFEARWKSIEKKIPSVADDSHWFVAGDMEPGNAYVPPKKQKLSPVKANYGHVPSMSIAEKQRLSLELDAMLEELPDNIISVLKNSTLGSSQATDEEIEVDFDNLSDGTLFTIRKLLDDYLLEKEKRNLNTEQPKIEIQHDFQTHANKDDDPAEEEVDIMGNDEPPLSSSPPVKDDIDDARKDSQSSTAGEEHVVESSIPATVPNGNVNATAQNSEPGNADNTGESNEGALNGTAENCSMSNASIEHNNQEEEDAPPGRQVSPEKLYRAALLRGRFADIIIKAQEQSVENREHPDPEKLKLEREELERRRKEEKARLQAEAKDAEEARQKAQLEAEAEERRKREAEREAARNALQQMEKTVYINEDSQFIQDFEMLSCPPAEDLDVSKDDDLGSFKFQGYTNPLEQLGLYMKNDEEEDEEQHPSLVPCTSVETITPPTPTLD